jgi:hypothetical protein
MIKIQNIWTGKIKSFDDKYEAIKYIRRNGEFDWIIL